MSGWHQVKISTADKYFSIWIRLRDRKCQKCGKQGTGPQGIFGLQASHFVKRRHEAVRFDPLNADALCPGCHRWFEEHKTEYETWKMEKEGQHVVEMLYVLSQTYRKKERTLEAQYWKKRIKEEFPHA